MKRLLAYGAGALILAAALAALLLPALVDTPAVRAEIQRRLAEALHGRITWQALEVSLLPAPHGELRGVRIEIPGKLSAAADELNVYLRLWPLLFGHVEIASISIQKPHIRVVAHDNGGKDAPLDAVKMYRAAIEPAARALQDFAPDMTLRLEQASVEIGTAFALRDLRASARTDHRGVALEGSAASSLWKRLAIEARVEYDDLSARADVTLDALVVDKDVPAATLRAKLRTDAKTALECDFDASVGSVGSAKGRLLLPAGKPPELAANLDAVDVARALALAKLKVSGLDIIEAAEGKLSAKTTAHLGPDWRLHLDVTRSDAAVKLAPLPWKASAHAARVTVTAKHVHVASAKGTVGDSTFEHVAAQIDLGKTPRLSAASGRATLALEQWFPWLRTKAPLEEIASLSGSLDVALHRLALRFDRPQDVAFDAAATPRKVSAALKMLPAAVSVADGAIHLNSKQVRLEKLRVAMLDARALVSGSFSFNTSALELALAEGTAGEKLIGWALERGQVPPRLEPKAPLRFMAQRIAWAPKGALEVDARVDFDGGPAVGLALAWRPELLELKRLTVKDAHSDAVFGATVAADLVHASFSGTFQGRSMNEMLRQRTLADAGTAQGELRVTLDRAQPRRSGAEGRLRVDALDLSWLAGRKLVIERADLASDRSGMRVAESSFSWEEQRFRLSGEGRRSPAGPVINARLESPGFVLDRLVPPREKPSPAAEKAAPPFEESAIWPLPATGRIEVRSGFVQFRRHRIEPLEASLTFEPRRARFEIQAARTCGVSFPAELEATPDDITATARISMKDEPLASAMRCLTGDTVEITGTADLNAVLKTRGRRPNLVRNMTGTAQAELRKGHMKRFAVIGNILSFRDVAAISKMKEEGFAYRSMTARGRFEAGEFLVDEAFFDSDAVRLAAHGRVDLLGADSRLTVLVGLLTNVDRFAGAVPILGDVFGGSMTALPLSVSGDIRDPRVVPLGPRAVSDRLLGIFERTLKLPEKLLVKPGASPEKTPP